MGGLLWTGMAWQLCDPCGQIALPACFSGEQQRGCLAWIEQVFDPQADAVVATRPTLLVRNNV